MFYYEVMCVRNTVWKVLRKRVETCYFEPFAARSLPVANRKTVCWNVLEHSFLTHIRSWFSDSDTSFGYVKGGGKG